MELNEDTFLLYAMHYYENPHCRNIDEFKGDLNTIKYLKRLFKRYKDTKNLEDLRLRLVLNHLIVFYNVFHSDAATQILFFKIDIDQWSILKTFLLYLGYVPENRGFKVHQSHILVDVMIDMEIANALRKI